MGTLEEKIKEFFKNKKLHDNPIVRHPMLSGIATYFVMEYARNKFPQLKDLGINESFSLLLGYGTYLGLGSIKEYVLEQRKKVLKFGTGIYDWILNNPKIAGLFGALAGAIIAHKSKIETINYVHNLEYSCKIPAYLFDQTSKNILGRAIIAGLLTESSVRGLKNIRKIKKSIRKIKTNAAEKAWNFIFEHPLLLSCATSVASFAYIYNRSHELRINYETRARAIVHGINEQDRLYFFRKPPIESIIEYPKQAANLFFIEGGMAFLGTLFLLIAGGYALHTYSIREHGLRARKLYNIAAGRKRAAITNQKALADLPNSLEKKVEDIAELGNMYYDEGKEEEAFRQYRWAMSLLAKKSDDAAYTDFMRKVPGISRLIRLYKRRRGAKNKKQTDINEIFIDILNKNRKALGKINERLASEKDPATIYLYAKALEVFGEKEEAEKQKERAVVLKLGENPNLSLLSGSKNPVFRFEEPMLNAEVIAKAGSEESLKEEMAITRRAERLIADFDGLYVPAPIGIIEHNGRKYYIMEYASGELLSDSIKRIENINGSTEKDKKRKDLEQRIIEISGFLGMLHAGLNTDFRPRDHVEAVGKKLKEKGIGPQQIKNICINLAQPVKSLDAMPLVYHKDAHPGNWYTDEFGITALDFEANGTVRAQIDMAKLLSRHRLFDYPTQARFLDSYRQAFMKYSKNQMRIPDRIFHLAYLNAGIITAFETYSSSVENQPIISDALLNAGEAVEIIRKEFPEYYETNRTAYENLKKQIDKLI